MPFPAITAVDNCLLSDIILTKKFIILLLLLGAHRLSTMKLFCINNMFLNYLSVTLIPTEVLEHSTKGKPLYKFEYRAYVDKTSCVIAFLKEYISRRNKHGGWPQTSSLSPTENHSKELPQTIRRCIKGIFIVNNIVNFSPHSCWAASSSKAIQIDVTIDEIIRRSCWKNRKNFFKFWQGNNRISICVGGYRF